VSRSCNFSCRYCCSDSGPGVKESVNVEQAVRTLSDIVARVQGAGYETRVEKLIFSGGGEPAVEENLSHVEELYSSLKDEGFAPQVVKIVTNGSLLGLYTELLPFLLEENVPTITFISSDPMHREEWRRLGLKTSEYVKACEALWFSATQAFPAIGRKEENSLVIEGARGKVPHMLVFYDLFAREKLLLPLGRGRDLPRKLAYQVCPGGSPIQIREDEKGREELLLMPVIDTVSGKIAPTTWCGPNPESRERVFLNGRDFTMKLLDAFLESDEETRTRISDPDFYSRKISEFNKQKTGDPSCRHCSIGKYFGEFVEELANYFS